MRIQNYLWLMVAAVILAASPAFAAEAVSISVEKDGSVRLHTKQISLEELAVLAAAEAKKEKHARIHVLAEKGISAEAIAAVMNTCRKAGIIHITVSELEKKE